jgi:hypothetical protein
MAPAVAIVVASLLRRTANALRDKWPLAITIDPAPAPSGKYVRLLSSIPFQNKLEETVRQKPSRLAAPEEQLNAALR